MKHLKEYNNFNKVPDASERRVFAHYFFVTDPKTPGYQKNLDMYFAIIPDLTEFDLIFIMKWNLTKPDKPIKFQNEDYYGLLDEIYHNNADVNIQTKWGYTALIWASWKGHINIVKYLVEAGANLNLQDEYGDTALIMASLFGYIDIVKYLVEAGADLNIQNNSGNTALIWASIHEHTDIVKYLKSKGAK